MLPAPSFQVPKRKQAAEAGERENIDHLQARDRACVELGTHDQASSIVPHAIESGESFRNFLRACSSVNSSLFHEVLLCFWLILGPWRSGYRTIKGFSTIVFGSIGICRMIIARPLRRIAMTPRDVQRRISHSSRPTCCHMYC